MTNYDENIARFRGTVMLYGLDGLNILKNTYLTIVGIGGVGSWALESIVRTGIGHIRIFDHDDINITNTNRQCHTLSSTIGECKASTFAQRMKDINPSIDVEYYKEFITQNNINKYFPKEDANKWYVIDAIDSIDSKAALVNHLKRNHYRFISSGGAGGKTTASNICIEDLSKVEQDPLLSKLKTQLRDNYGFTAIGNHKFGIKCAFVKAQKSNPKLINSEEQLCQISQYFENNIITFGACMHVTASLGLRIAENMIERIIKDGKQST